MSFYPAASANPDFPAIRIDGDKQFEVEVERILRHIHFGSRSRVGALIVNRILLNGDRRERVIIRDPRRLLSNAITSPLGSRNGSAQPASTPTDPLSHPGRGAGAVIRYFPKDWSAIGTGEPGASRDEVLLHELVHAYMMQRGICNMQNMRRLNIPVIAARVKNFDQVDDFYAIMIANVYASECGRSPRLDHRASVALNRNAISVNSDPRFQMFFAAFAHAAPDMVAELRAIDTWFNPWRPQFGLVDGASAHNDP